MRASFSRIVIWHSGDGDHLAGAGKVIEMELTARGGGSIRIRVDGVTGLIEDH